MKRLLFLVIAIVVGVSTYDYATSAGHYGLVVVAGVVAVLVLASKIVD
ncbi:hypothetical protein ACWDSJ_15945 [Nocardia sp. NPDC003482]